MTVISHQVGERVIGRYDKWGIKAGHEYEVTVEWPPFVAVRDVETDEDFGLSHSSVDGTPHGNILASQFNKKEESDGYN